MNVIHLTRSDYQRMRWRNDGGWTTQLARHPAQGGDADCQWRVSIAEIERDGDFSAYAGIDRSLVMLEGAGVELLFDHRDAVLLNQRGQISGFAGERMVHCRLIDGPTRDFNVFTRRDRFTHKVLFRPLAGPMVLFPEAGVTWLVHVVSGTLRQQHIAQAASIREGETLLIESNGDGRQVVLSGSGELLLARLSSVACM